jgi:hypothetical protein
MNLLEIILSTREDFTQHGLHLNVTSKTKVAKLMSQNISLLSEIRKKHPIILKWISTLNDPSTVNNISKVMNEEHVGIGNKGGNDDQIDSINQGIKTSILVNNIPKVMEEEQVVTNNEERNKDQADFKKTKELDHLLDQRGFLTQEVMICYGYKI